MLDFERIIITSPNGKETLTTSGKFCENVVLPRYFNDDIEVYTFIKSNPQLFISYSFVRLQTVVLL